MPRNTRGTGVLLILLLAGIIFGTLIGELLGNYLPFLYLSESVGMSPTTIDLAAATFTIGATLKVNVATIIGFFLALFIYFRL